MGATDRTLAIWKFEANTTEDLRVYQVIVTDASGNANGGNVSNLKLFVDGVQVGATVPALGAATSGTGTFGSAVGSPMFTITKGGSKLVTLKADATSFANGATAGGSVTMKVDVPTTITGVASDTMIARGESGNFALTTSTGAKTANAQFQYRTTLSAALACGNSTCTHGRGANDRVASLTLTGTSSQDAQFRAVTNNAADATTLFFGADNDATITVGTDTTNQVDGTSVSFTPTGGQSLTKAGFAPSAAADLSGTSRVSFWVRSSTAESANDLVFHVSEADATLTTTSGTGINVPALSANTWTFVDAAWGNTTAQRDAVTSYGLTSAAMTADGVIRLDQINFYNDSIVYDITGKLVAQAQGLVFQLKDSGGTVRATGYIAGTAQDTATTTKLFFSANQNIGAVAQVFDLFVNSSTLVRDPDTSTDNVSYSLTLGNNSSAGNFRWWDQGVTATSPITWFNGSSPITATLSY